MGSSSTTRIFWVMLLPPILWIIRRESQKTVKPEQSSAAKPQASDVQKGDLALLFVGIAQRAVLCVVARHGAAAAPVRLPLCSSHMRHHLTWPLNAVVAVGIALIISGVVLLESFPDVPERTEG